MGGSGAVVCAVLPMQSSASTGLLTLVGHLCLAPAVASRVMLRNVIFVCINFPFLSTRREKVIFPTLVMGK